jgi:hypothetical protein
MLLEGAQLKPLRDDVESELRKVTETLLGEDFVWLRGFPDSAQQYWQYELTIYEETENPYHLSCGLFTGERRFRNSDLGIQAFFENNDKIVEFIHHAVSTGAMKGLVPLLGKAQSLLPAEAVTPSRGGAYVTLCSYVYSVNEWLKNVCNEDLLLLALDNEHRGSLLMDCAQNRRCRIKVPGSGGPIFLTIPFDKVGCFERHERVGGYREQPYFEYDVSLSFAGEDRKYVDRVANVLRQKKLRIFFDRYEQAALWGKDLYTHLEEVYRKRARFCVVFLSESYRKNLWTNHERESAQIRAFEENKECLLPVRLDDTVVPGVMPRISYVHKKDVTIAELVGLIQKKLHGF